MNTPDDSGAVGVELPLLASEAPMALPTVLDPFQLRMA
jgi:hypothetical protein